MNTAGSGKGARFHIKHTDSPTVFSILAHNELEIMKVEVGDAGRSATCFLDGRVMAKIQFKDEVITLSFVAKTEKNNKPEKEKRKERKESARCYTFFTGW